jgi:hypothetical protein
MESDRHQSIALAERQGNRAEAYAGRPPFRRFVAFPPLSRRAAIRGGHPVRITV